MQDMTPHEIDDFLAGARIGRLCMAGADGRPYTIPLPFCWLGGALYVRLPLTGRKGQILAENDRVCFEADAFTDTLDDYASVLIEGRLVPVADVAEKRRVKEANDDKYNRLRGGHRPGHGRSKPAAELPLRKLVVEQVGGRRKEHAAPETAQTSECAGVGPRAAPKCTGERAGPCRPDSGRSPEPLPRSETSSDLRSDRTGTVRLSPPRDRYDSDDLTTGATEGATQTW